MSKYVFPGLIGLLALLALACSSSTKTKPAASSGTTPAAGIIGGQVTLRLGYQPNITHATAIVGLGAGIFARDLGSTVKLQTASFNAGPAEVEALFSDALDAAYIGPNPAINAFVRSKGAAIRIIAGATSGGAFFVVRPEISSAADLRGKKVASPQLGNTQDVALRAWLKRQGLKTDAQGGGDVLVTPQENADTLETFKIGQIAGAWVPEPWATRLVMEGGGKILVDERSLWPAGQFVTTLLIVRTAFVTQHPDVVDGLLHGQIDANAFVNARPAEAQRLVNDAIEKITGKRIGDAIITAAWRNLSFTNDPLLGSLRKSVADATALGFLDLGAVKLDQIAALQPLNTALKATGNAEVAAR